MSDPTVALYHQVALVFGDTATPVMASCRACGGLVSLHPVDLATHAARDRAVQAQGERMDAMARAIDRATAVIG